VLCSFLRERGIRNANVRNGFSRTISDENGVATTAEAGPSGSASPAPVAGPSGMNRSLAAIGETEVDDAGASPLTGDTPNTSRIGSTAPGTPAAEQDEDMLEVVASSSKSVTVTTTTTTKQKITKKKKKKDEDDEEEYKEDFFAAPAAKKARYADRKPGSFAMCAECNKKVRVC
jgi:DNA-directed RNA polymerase subunit M/transcription elongation factor TFIIS